MKRLILCIALLMPLASNAQQHHEFGLSAGVSGYYGDLQPEMFPDYGLKAMGGFVYKYYMSPHVGVRLGFSYTNITAADSLSDIPARKERNLSFASDLLEFHGAFEFNLLPIEKDRAKFTPYVFAGIGIFYYNPYTQGVNGEKIYLRPLGTEGQNIPSYPDRREYSLVNVSFPVGGGLKFFLGKTLLITPEIGFRYTNTDYLDDVSKSYVNMNTLKDYRGQQAVDYSFRTDELAGWDGNYPDYRFQRGDSKTNDLYWFGNLTITVYLRAFGNMLDYWQADCPAFLKSGRTK
ncbi:MAG: hypothetical protein H6551_00980 [Chitinophagales bacterium]|nr:hypothetical protein [Chitinophagaceae bacterium]MCB9063697.1 hypothetical protein [Chitinophagales bacterium]